MERFCDFWAFHQLWMRDKPTAEAEKHLKDSACSCVQRWQRQVYSRTAQGSDIVCGVTGYRSLISYTQRCSSPSSAHWCRFNPHMLKLRRAYLQRTISHCVLVGLIHSPSAPAGFLPGCCSLGHLPQQRWWEERTHHSPPGLLLIIDLITCLI